MMGIFWRYLQRLTERINIYRQGDVLNILITCKVLLFFTLAINVMIFFWVLNTFIFSAIQRNESVHSKLAVKVSAVTGSVTAHVADMLT